MSDEELESAQQELLELDAHLRSTIRAKAKLQKMVELRQRLTAADLPDWIGSDLLDAMVEAEGEQAATREAALLDNMSPQQVIEHVQQANSRQPHR